MIDRFNSMRHEFELFMDAVGGLFQKHPTITKDPFPIVHSIRKRIKSENHLRNKLQRKADKGELVDAENCFDQITDFAGIRVLHLKQEDFKTIKDVIDERVTNRDWHLFETPIAYTWDPEYERYFLELGCRCRRKDSFYTSVHFVVKPRPDSPLSCEIQVRTLFEEIWGEIDHQLNYPNSTTIRSCAEQLHVLAKVVGAGSRLVTSIFNSVDANSVPARPGNDS
ncbi:RelA/SpoT domain-containing protein [Bradyrhizobium aeschynomenes]|uniref:RelA/SpoT domain-containing protein n=1 Tax=Bradyrhizobium aeschynomenes TaxID=2734909 RepID=UPI001AED4FEE|nr:RelA/SpoT domain-containing protein [Bradyrhizobium aeschynomenes]